MSPIYSLRNISYLLIALLAGISPKASADSSKLVNIAVYFGYNDQHPDETVVDSSEKQNFISLLTSPGTSSSCAIPELCGFQLDLSTQKAVFYKEVQGTNGSLLIRVTLHHSSVTSYDPINRGDQQEIQTAKSAREKQKFLFDIRTADAVFFVGHARYGGGPDFGPAALLTKNNDVSETYYRRHHESAQSLVSALSNALNLKLFAYLGCDSQKHFLAEFREANKTTRFLLVNSIEVPAQMDEGLVEGFSYFIESIRGIESHALKTPGFHIFMGL